MRKKISIKHSGIVTNIKLKDNCVTAVSKIKKSLIESNVCDAEIVVEEKFSKIIVENVFPHQILLFDRNQTEKVFKAWVPNNEGFFEKKLVVLSEKYEFYSDRVFKGVLKDWLTDERYYGIIVAV